MKKKYKIGRLPIIAYIIFLGVSIAYLLNVFPFEAWAFCSITTIMMTCFDGAFKECD